MNAVSLSNNIEDMEAQLAAMEAGTIPLQAVDLTKFAAPVVSDTEAQLAALIGQTEDAVVEATAEAVQADEAPEAVAVALYDKEAVSKVASAFKRAIDIYVDTANKSGKTVKASTHPLYSTEVADWPANDILNSSSRLRDSGTIDLPVTPDNIEDYRPLFAEAQAMVRVAIDKPEAAAKAAKAEKAPKAAKAAVVKAPKAATEPKAELPVVAALTFVTDSGTLTFSQDRTKAISMPVVLHLEGDSTAVQKHRGHQVDPSRSASCIPVMPNGDVFDATGNPYPADSSDETVRPTDEQWRDYAKIGYEAFRMIGLLPEVRARSKDVVENILKAAGLKLDLPYAETAVSDALRDLALFGYAEQFMQGRSRIFKAVTKAS